MYDYQNVRMKKPLNYAFGKKDRGLLTLNRDNSPSPASFNAIEMEWAKETNSNIV